MFSEKLNDAKTHADRPLRRLRVQADADLNQIIVAAVVRRVPDIDFSTATAASLALASISSRPVRQAATRQSL